MSRSVFVVLTGVLLAFAHCTEDTILDSRFMYEYRVIQKMVHLEDDNQDLRHTVTNLIQRLEGVITKNEELEGMIGELRRNGRISTGNTYIRWGRTTCPSETGARVLYDGYVGGSSHDQSGGGSNYLCLPRDPDLANIIGGLRSLLYGAEYELGNTDSPLNGLQNEDVPCAVCYTPNTNVVMIPAKNSCHDGWVLEYSGFLMSGYYGHSGRTTHICVDGEAEGLDDSYGNQNGAMLYFVETRCGSLPCGPYQDNYELTCAVCSLPPGMVYSEPNNDA